MRTYAYITVAILCFATACTNARPRPVEWTAPVRHAPYPLDGEPRGAPIGSTPQCPQVQLLSYDGDVIPYSRPVKVNPFFRERLQQFELIVRRVATEIYGRPPAEILHWGVYNCRRVRGKAKLSEHGLANAIDVWGFRFAEDDAVDGPHAASFDVVLEKHWDGGSGLADRHAAFLRRLVRALAARPDIFRGMLGPGFPGHDDHFHFDMAPRRFLAVEE